MRGFDIVTDVTPVRRGRDMVAVRFLAAVPTMSQGYWGAIARYANQPNILQNQHNSQLQAWGVQQQTQAEEQAGMMSGIGAIFGGLMGTI